jgi:chromosomal replication initiation ATPase DnaA
MISAYIISGITNTNPKILPPKRIIKTVCEYYELPESVILKKCRKRSYVEARYMSAYLIRKHTTLSLNETALFFGKAISGYTDIIKAVKFIDGQLNSKGDNKIKSDFFIIETRLCPTINSIKTKI